MPEAPLPLAAEEAARSRLVLDRLRSVAGSGGLLAFDRFMEIALYAPEIGFYERARTPLGPSGDFYTAAHASPLFARALADRVRAVRGSLGNPGRFSIVELGPGDGTLAEGLRTSLAEEPSGLEYVLVDRSPARVREAERRLSRVTSPIPLRRAESVASLGPFTGVVLANEFLDAQPARRLRWSEGVWHELGIRVASHGVEAAELGTARPVPGRPLPPVSDEPLTFELSPIAEAIVREVADHLEAGEAIFLDYGYEESELMRGHPNGTLAAVRDHRVVADPFQDPGTVDLSTFVNFSRIREAGRSSGLVELSFRSQAEALGAWGLPGLLEAALRESGNAEAKVRTQLAAKNLLFGFERFRALELAPPASAGSLRT
jgi:SAM-dependent MidA family methyltransferase